MVVHPTSGDVFDMYQWGTKILTRTDTRGTGMKDHAHALVEG